MGNRVQNIRKAKFVMQQGRCAYCCQPMWEDDGEQFAHLHGLSLSKARLLRSTAEHLTARHDCGRDSHQNIVAACSYCNAMRHRTPKPKSPCDFVQKVRRKLIQGKWHGIMIMPIVKR